MPDKVLDEMRELNIKEVNLLKKLEEGGAVKKKG